MSLGRPTTPTQSNIPIDSLDASGVFTNRNASPLANTLNGDTESFTSSTFIHDYQSQNPQSHYTNFNFHAGDHTPAAMGARASDHHIAANVVLDSGYTNPSNFAHENEPRSLLIPFYWPWTLLNSIIRIALRTIAIAGVETAPRDILPQHIKDRKDHPGTDARFPPSFNPNRAADSRTLQRMSSPRRPSCSG
ncbi:hypothetical protein PM082_024031 [Marasmius tenuissimus]|nr:hypothetical protein PM082_024031 [Marasmius tenuissimus]